MSRARVLAAVMVVVLLLAGVTGCKEDAVDSGGKPKSEPAEIPEAFAVDEAGAADLAVTAEGGGAAVSMGDAKAAVWVPAGAAPEGAEWSIAPLAETPAGVEKPLAAGVWVDTAGNEPTDWCSIGFSIPGSAPNAVIVKLADDGTVAEFVPTTRYEQDGVTLLSAYVESFSAYVPTEAQAKDEKAIADAWAKGHTVDWTIKVTGTETQNVEGWTFEYELDLFASGGSGGIGMGGPFKGHANLWLKGHYDAPADMPFFAFGDIDASGRDDNLQFLVFEHRLASLLTGDPEPDAITGHGTMNLTGPAELGIVVAGPGVVGGDTRTATGTTPMPFTLVISGEDVQVEIPNVGIFPGKILRTEVQTP